MPHCHLSSQATPRRSYGCKWLFDSFIPYTLQVLDVVDLLYQYIKMLRDIGPQEWVFKELQSMGMMEFKFAEEDSADNYVVRLACTDLSSLSFLSFKGPQDSLEFSFYLFRYSLPPCPQRSISLLSVMSVFSESAIYLGSGM